MKGIILAGGLGSRLAPMTHVTNKHLLPVYDRPMIHFPIEQLVGAGIEEILIVTGGNAAGDFLRLLGNGRDFGLRHLNYTYQDGEGGIAEALGLAEYFADEGPVCVILGDNIFENPIRPAVDAYRADPTGAMVLLKEVDDPERFGVARFEADGSEGAATGELGQRVSTGVGARIAEIIEKPADPPSRFAVTGCYLYDARVFEIIRGLSPSARGELEITDVNNRYLGWGELRHHVVDGWWTDAGTIPSLHRASRLVAAQRTSTENA